jgi:hypothetical protein
MVQLGNVDNTADSAKPVSTATTTQLNLKANALNPAFSGTATGLSKAMVQLGNVDNTSDALKPVSTATTAQLLLKANALNPAFSGTATGLSKAMVQLENVDNTSDALKPVSTAMTNALDLKTDTSVTSNSAVAWSEGLVNGFHFLNTGTDALVVRTNSGAISANFMGNVGGTATDGKVIFYKDFDVGGNQKLTGSLTVGSTNIMTELGTKATAASVDLKAPKNNPALTGTATAANLTVSGDLLVGATNVLTTLNKKVEYLNTPLLLDIIEVDTIRNKSTAYATPTVKFDCSIAVVGNVNISGSAILMVDGLNIVTALNSKSTTSDLNLKANLASPTFTGTVNGLSKSMVQLGNVDNTTDLLKPVSTATTTQLNLKANSADVFLKTATYSRTESEALFTYKIDTYTSPLRLAINPVTFATDLRKSRG